MGLLSYLINKLKYMGRRQGTIEPRKKARQMLKLAKGNFDLAYKRIDKRIAKSVYQTIGYFYYIDVKDELQRMQKDPKRIKPPE